MLTEYSQIYEQIRNGVGIPTPDPGVATSPSVQVSDTGIASHENLDFVTRQDFQLQMSNLQTAFSQFQSNIMTVLSAQSIHPGGLSISNCVSTDTNLASCSSFPRQYVQTSSFNSWNPVQSSQPVLPLLFLAVKVA